MGQTRAGGMQALSLPAPEQFSGRLISLPLPVTNNGQPCPARGGEGVPRGAVREQSPSTREQSSSTDRDLRRVAEMPEAATTRPHSPLSLNSDGQRHPLENSLAVFTLVSGLIVFAVGWVVELSALASVLGIVTMLVGLYAQMISATRAERMIIVTGLVAAFVGTALAFGHGGFWS